MISSRASSRSLAELWAKGDRIAQRIGSAVGRSISRLAGTGILASLELPLVDDVLEGEIHLAASTDAPVLITAPTVAAARRIAEAIQERWPDRYSQSLTVVRGSVARDRLVTSLEGSAGPVLFENIGAFDERGQAVLWEFLEHRARYRPGDPRYRRILSTGLPDLYSRVQAGTFREGLYYRLNTFYINVCLPVTVSERTAPAAGIAH